MKKIMLLTLILLLANAGNAASAETSEAPGQIIIAAGSRPSALASQEHFTGKVRVDPAFKTQNPARSYGSYVTFEPGSRTDWHVHPLGQVLIVTFGSGLTQEWGKPVQRIKTGDIVICPAGVKHWHGAASDTGMTHLAIGEHLNGKQAEWLEKVSDEQYSGINPPMNKSEKESKK